MAVVAACGSGNEAPAGPPRAAIVDQLGTSHPNPDFRSEATRKLEAAGYQVDYYPGDQVSVDFFDELDHMHYDFLVLRVHIARFQGEWRGETYDNPVLFTSEPYVSDEYESQQLDLQLNPVFAYEGAPQYFGIGPNFIRSGGSYKDAAVIMMGCSGLSTDAMAQAFADKGAASVIGWSDLVSADHTDQATLELLDRLLGDHLSAQEAVARTNQDVGDDPIYKSHLLAYAQ